MLAEHVDDLGIEAGSSQRCDRRPRRFGPTAPVERLDDAGDADQTRRDRYPFTSHSTSAAPVPSLSGVLDGLDNRLRQSETHRQRIGGDTAGTVGTLGLDYMASVATPVVEWVGDPGDRTGTEGERAGLRIEPEQLRESHRHDAAVQRVIHGPPHAEIADQAQRCQQVRRTDPGVVLTRRTRHPTTVRLPTIGRSAAIQEVPR
ncbi:MAG: hypothetical protein M5U19_07445 [Microthrixaceae bacterium]|nr:hypothetical protein [Microthrixaceae bacterium]